ncbi:MAG TPA: AMP-binding protein [Mycobacterium sp.]|nr:AMP-binding protein [Mycobacterium sp.]
MTGLDTPLTPLRFLRRAADVYPDKTAIVDGPRRFSYTEAAESAAALARAIAAGGVGAGDSIVYLASNSAELVIAHFGVPLAGSVLVAINTRLSSDEIAYILDHCSARLVFADGSLADQHGAVLASAAAELVVLPEQDGTGGTYESFLARGCAAAEPEWAVADETATIAVLSGYTSAARRKNRSGVSGVSSPVNRFLLCGGSPAAPTAGPSRT